MESPRDQFEEAVRQWADGDDRKVAALLAETCREAGESGWEHTFGRVGAATVDAVALVTACYRERGGLVALEQAIRKVDDQQAKPAGDPDDEPFTVDLPGHLVAELDRIESKLACDEVASIAVCHFASLTHDEQAAAIKSYREDRLEHAHAAGKGGVA